MNDQKRKPGQNGLILVTIMIFGFIAGYFYYFKAFSDREYALPVPANLYDKNFIRFKDVKFDFSFFTDNVFASLRTIGESPLGVGQTGKRNIFAPF